MTNGTDRISKTENKIVQNKNVKIGNQTYKTKNLISQFNISLNLSSYSFLKITFFVALNRHVVAKKTVEKSNATFVTKTLTKGIKRG